MSPLDPTTSIWERLRHITLDQLVTETKLAGAATVLNGVTTPEAWPFTLLLLIAKPGSEGCLSLAAEFSERLRARAAWNTADSRHGSERDTLRWMAQTVHQAHHDGPLAECPKATCRAALAVEAAP